MMCQINIHYFVDGDVYADITNFSEDSYCGILTDTVYLDGADETNWKAFVGTLEECKAFCDEHRLEYHVCSGVN